MSQGQALSEQPLRALAPALEWSWKGGAGTSAGPCLKEPHQEPLPVEACGGLLACVPELTLRVPYYLI